LEEFYFYIFFAARKFACRVVKRQERRVAMLSPTPAVKFTYTVLRLGGGTLEVVGLYGREQTLISQTLADFAVDLNEIFAAR